MEPSSGMILFSTTHLSMAYVVGRSFATLSSQWFIHWATVCA